MTQVVRDKKREGNAEITIDRVDHFGRVRSDAIDIEWYCGDTRTFGVEAVVRALGQIDKARFSPGVWVYVPSKRKYAGGVLLRVEGKRLYIAEDLDDCNELEACYNVPWTSFRKAIEKELQEDS